MKLYLNKDDLKRSARCLGALVSPPSRLFLQPEPLQKARYEPLSAIIERLETATSAVSLLFTALHWSHSSPRLVVIGAVKSIAK